MENDADKHFQTAGQVTGIDQQNQSVQAQVFDPAEFKGEGINKETIGILILLVLTFFTPLGPVLFLPLLLLGMYKAVKFVGGGNKNPETMTPLQKNPIYKLFRMVLILGISFVLLIVGLIALVFIGLATGAIELDFGS